jgi:3'-phosphoadenosine 5'-phosphosulfate (PAPS) 3'-phosphatase
MNAIEVLENPPACYFKFPKPQQGGGSLWDFAATAAIFNECGASARDFDGQSLELNRAESTFMNHRGVLFATDAALAEEIQGLLPIVAET